MPKLVQKSGYVKDGKAGGYMNYIATRENVEKLDRKVVSDQEKIADKKAEIQKHQQKIAELQEDIKRLEANIAKNQEKRAGAQEEHNKASENQKAVEGQVEKYRSLSE